MQLVFLFLAGLVSYLMAIHLPWVAIVPILAFTFVLCFLIWIFPAPNLERMLEAADSGNPMRTSNTPILVIVGVVAGTITGLCMKYPDLRETITNFLIP